MAQFDVHRTPGRLRGVVPYVVVLQSRRFDRHERRLVAPLIAAEAGPGYPELAPRFLVEGRQVVLDPLQAQSVAADSLGPAIATLADDDSATRIVAALDALLTRAYG